MKIPTAERFFAPQGEGLYAGTQMAFIRTVGCSVGKSVCSACDTEFDRMLPSYGGGVYDVAELLAWTGACEHVCITGGEPLDRDLRPLLRALVDAKKMPHIETSGTKRPDWLDPVRPPFEARGEHAIGYPSDRRPGTVAWQWSKLWLTVSPKPGYLPEMVASADEIKVILGGLGSGSGWPTVEDAVRWADNGRLVYVQPRNDVLRINGENMRAALAVVASHPQLRLSTQLHKYVQTR